MAAHREVMWFRRARRALLRGCGACCGGWTCGGRVRGAGRSLGPGKCGKRGDGVLLRHVDLVRHRWGGCAPNQWAARTRGEVREAGASVPAGGQAARLWGTDESVLSLGSGRFWWRCAPNQRFARTQGKERGRGVVRPRGATASGQPARPTGTPLAAPAVAPLRGLRARRDVRLLPARLKASGRAGGEANGRPESAGE